MRSEVARCPVKQLQALYLRNTFLPSTACKEATLTWLVDPVEGSFPMKQFSEVRVKQNLAQYSAERSSPVLGATDNYHGNTEGIGALI